MQIGDHDEAVAGDGNPLSVTSRLNDPLVITPESQNDYIQFTIGTQSWSSSAKGGVPGCSVGGWDPRSGYPSVSIPSVLVHD